MPRVLFTPILERHLECPPCEVEGRTVRDVLGMVFEQNPNLRRYVLDEQDRLRQHVIVFVDGDTVADRIRLSDVVGADAEIYVMQSLAGG